MDNIFHQFDVKIQTIGVRRKEEVVFDFVLGKIENFP
jgi:hypothetical protein